LNTLIFMPTGLCDTGDPIWSPFFQSSLPNLSQNSSTKPRYWMRDVKVLDQPFPKKREPFFFFSSIAAHSFAKRPLQIRIIRETRFSPMPSPSSPETSARPHSGAARRRRASRWLAAARAASAPWCALPVPPCGLGRGCSRWCEDMTKSQRPTHPGSRRGTRAKGQPETQGENQGEGPWSDRNGRGEGDGGDGYREGGDPRAKAG